MKRAASVRKNSRLSASLKTEPVRRRSRSRYVLCVRNHGYPASLDLRKVYRRIADSRAERHGLVRVVDETGESYLYPQRYFTPIVITKATLKTLSSVR